MKLPIYQVDAFTSELFSGNPAAVCFLDAWMDDALLQSIAVENNLSDTAFLVPNESGFDLRWFTPMAEVALCGHATLASAFILFTKRNWSAPTVRFQTRWSGELSVSRQGDLLEMDFPARPSHPCTPPEGLAEALHLKPEKVFASAEDLMVVLDDERAVRTLAPDFEGLQKIDCRGLIVTARGDQSDFVSRFFAPRFGIPEDPVTGSAHCVLAPYWADLLHKDFLHAFQVSRRGGELFCANRGDRVGISGKAVLYLEGTLKL